MALGRIFDKFKRRRGRAPGMDEWARRSDPEQIEQARAGLAPGPMTEQYFGDMPSPDPISEGYMLPPGVDPNQQSILQGGEAQFEDAPRPRMMFPVPEDVLDYPPGAPYEGIGRGLMEGGGNAYNLLKRAYNKWGPGGNDDINMEEEYMDSPIQPPKGMIFDEGWQEGQYQDPYYDEGDYA